MNFIVRFWWKCCAFARRCLLALVHVNDPWDSQQLDLERPALRRMIARAVWENRHEQRGARIVRKYSRDPVVERRERWIEQRKAAQGRVMRMVR